MIDRINLLPSRKRDRGTAGPESRWFLLALGLALVVLAGLGAREIVQSRTLEKRLKELVNDRDRLAAEQQTASAVVGRLKALADEKAALQARLDALAALQQGRRSWSELLVGISRLTPEGLWLTGVESIAGDKGGQVPLVLRFEGKALSHERISELLGTLERDRNFQGIELISTAKGIYLDREVVDFKLSCRVGAR
ncbi:MAG: PilN domain-containing protein [Candidatus Methylomirabilia bacterium]